MFYLPRFKLILKARRLRMGHGRSRGSLLTRILSILFAKKSFVNSWSGDWKLLIFRDMDCLIERNIGLVCRELISMWSLTSNKILLTFVSFFLQLPQENCSFDQHFLLEWSDSWFLWPVYLNLLLRCYEKLEINHSGLVKWNHTGRACFWIPPRHQHL